MDQEPFTTPRDGDDPYIYSQQMSNPPFSLLYQDQYDPRCPPPTYLTIETLNQPRGIQKSDLLYGFEPYKSGGLIFTDPEVLDRQKGVILEVIQQVAAALMRGRGLVGLSLPIRIFEPRSTVERLADRWAYYPIFLQKCQQYDPVERLRRIIAAAVGSLSVYPGQQKPFNPLLGETMQASWPDGTQIYCEHTSHHPPITHFLIYGNGYKVYGYNELQAKFKKNSLVGTIIGPTHVEFEDGQKVTFTYPSFHSSGMMFGSRISNWEGEFTFNDNLGNSAVVSIRPDRKKSFFRKAIGKTDQLQGQINTSNNNEEQVTGSWLGEVRINDSVYWDIDMHAPLFHNFTINPLPSDWRYREDLIWLKRGNLDYAQRWKHKVENRQRADRTLRNAKQNNSLQLQMALADAVAEMLSTYVKSKNATAGQLTPFHASHTPSLGIREYVLWLKQHMRCSEACFVVALIYIDTVNMNSPSVDIEERCIHRLYVTGLMLAAKFYDDTFYKNSYYARIAGVSNKEINKLEYQLLVMLQFKLYINPQVFQIYENQLRANFLRQRGLVVIRTALSKLLNILMKRVLVAVIRGLTVHKELRPFQDFIAEFNSFIKRLKQEVDAPAEIFESLENQATHLYSALKFFKRESSYQEPCFKLYEEMMESMSSSNTLQEVEVLSTETYNKVLQLIERNFVKPQDLHDAQELIQIIFDVVFQSQRYKFQDESMLAEVQKNEKLEERLQKKQEELDNMQKAYNAQKDQLQNCIQERWELQNDARLMKMKQLELEGIVEGHKKNLMEGQKRLEGMQKQLQDEISKQKTLILQKDEENGQLQQKLNVNQGYLDEQNRLNKELEKFITTLKEEHKSKINQMQKEHYQQLKQVQETEHYNKIVLKSQLQAEIDQLQEKYLREEQERILAKQKYKGKLQSHREHTQQIYQQNQEATQQIQQLQINVEQLNKTITNLNQEIQHQKQTLVKEKTIYLAQSRKLQEQIMSLQRRLTAETVMNKKRLDDFTMQIKKDHSQEIHDLKQLHNQEMLDYKKSNQEHISTLEQKCLYDIERLNHQIKRLEGDKINIKREFKQEILKAEQNSQMKLQQLKRKNEENLAQLRKQYDQQMAEQRESLLKKHQADITNKLQSLQSQLSQMKDSHTQALKEIMNKNNIQIQHLKEKHKIDIKSNNQSFKKQLKDFENELFTQKVQHNQEMAEQQTIISFKSSEIQKLYDEIAQIKNRSQFIQTQYNQLYEEKLNLDKTIKELNKQISKLDKIHQNEIDDLKIQHEKEIEQSVSNQIQIQWHEKELLQKKVNQAKEKQRQKYNELFERFTQLQAFHLSRPSREEDINTIDRLKRTVFQRSIKLAQSHQDIKSLKMELFNKEQCYWKFFGNSPVIGTLHDRLQKRKGTKSVSRLSARVRDI